MPNHFRREAFGDHFGGLQNRFDDHFVGHVFAELTQVGSESRLTGGGAVAASTIDVPLVKQNSSTNNVARLASLLNQLRRIFGDQFLSEGWLRSGIAGGLSISRPAKRKEQSQGKDKALAKIHR